jgi:kinesin family protein 3/17
MKGATESVKVVVRCRPLFGKEIKEDRKSIVKVDCDGGRIYIKDPSNPDDKPRQYTFDATYDENTVQQNFYDESVFPLTECVLGGFNGTVFVYGQTGCGKTYTMVGYMDPPELKGVIPLSFDHIFTHIEGANSGVSYLVQVSYLEIYNEEVMDLLGKDPKKPMKVREHPEKGVYVEGLTYVLTKDTESTLLVMDKGIGNRSVAATLMNATSSRSHAIFSLLIEASEENEEPGGKPKVKQGKLNLVDLAGSERAAKTGATGDLLKEGAKINLSLSALGNVISALADGKGKIVPYRDSKLTRLLQDSLGGNTKTLMMCAVSPADYNFDETSSTLRYGTRAKNIKNKPKINEDPKDALLRQFKEEIESLKGLLANFQVGGGAAAAVITEMDEAGDIQLDAAELAAATGISEEDTSTQIAQLDTDGDGKLAATEICQSTGVGTESGQVEDENTPPSNDGSAPLGDEPLANDQQKLSADQDPAAALQASLFEKAQAALIAKIAMLESQMGTSGGAMTSRSSTEERVVDDEKRIAAREKAKARRTQNRLRAQQKLERKLKSEQKQLREKSANEIEHARSHAETVVDKNQQELLDLKLELARDREMMQDTIRNQTQYCKLLEQVVEALVLPSEMRKVWEKAVWIEEAECWNLPTFKPAKPFSVIHRYDGRITGGVTVQEDSRVAAGEEGPLPAARMSDFLGRERAAETTSQQRALQSADEAEESGSKLPMLVGNDGRVMKWHMSAETYKVEKELDKHNKHMSPTKGSDVAWQQNPNKQQRPPLDSDDGDDLYNFDIAVPVQAPPARRNTGAKRAESTTRKDSKSSEQKEGVVRTVDSNKHRSGRNEKRTDEQKAVSRDRRKEEFRERRRKKTRASATGNDVAETTAETANQQQSASESETDSDRGEQFANNAAKEGTAGQETNTEGSEERAEVGSKNSEGTYAGEFLDFKNMAEAQPSDNDEAAAQVAEVVCAGVAEASLAKEIMRLKETENRKQSSATEQKLEELWDDGSSDSA